MNWTDIKNFLAYLLGAIIGTLIVVFLGMETLSGFQLIFLCLLFALFDKVQRIETFNSR